MCVTTIRLLVSSPQSLSGEISLTFIRTRQCRRKGKKDREKGREKPSGGEKNKMKTGKQESTWSWKEESCRQTYLARACHRKSIPYVSWQDKSSVPSKKKKIEEIKKWRISSSNLNERV